MHRPKSVASRSLSDPPTLTDDDQGLLAKTADRLARKYGEVLNVSDIAHLLGMSESRVQRWMVDSAYGRALRARGIKVGRCVQWPVLVVAEFVVYGTPGDAA